MRDRQTAVTVDRSPSMQTYLTQLSTISQSRFRQARSKFYLLSGVSQAQTRYQ